MGGRPPSHTRSRSRLHGRQAARHSRCRLPGTGAGCREPEHHGPRLRRAPTPTPLLCLAFPPQPLLASRCLPPRALLVPPPPPSRARRCCPSCAHAHQHLCLLARACRRLRVLTSCAVCSGAGNARAVASRTVATSARCAACLLEQEHRGRHCWQVSVHGVARQDGAHASHLGMQQQEKPARREHAP